MLLSHVTASQTEMPPDMASIKPFGPIRNRALQHLVAYWFDKRCGRLMPALTDIDPTEIPSVLCKIWLCDYLSESGRFRYRLAGEEINDFWGFNLGGKCLDEIVPPERLESATKKCRTAVDYQPSSMIGPACL